MKKIGIILLCKIFVILVGCKELPPIVQLFKEHLNKEVNLKGYDNVHCLDKTYSYTQFRKQYPYIIVNYVDEECSTCKFKLKQWYKNSDKLLQIDGLGYVFIFRGKNYQNFIKYTIGKNSDYPFFFLSSEEFTYIINNPRIDRQIIDAGFLLDSNNRIQIIGSPLDSPKLGKMINKIVKQKNNEHI